MTGRDAPGRWRARLAPFVTLLLFAVALWVVTRLLAEYRLADVRDALSRVRPLALGLAVVAAAAGYLALVGYDYVAFRIVGRPMPLRAMLAPSFVSFAVSNSAPASVLTAGGVRARLYADRGLTAREAAAVAGVDVVTYVLGLCALAGVALLARPVAPTGAPPWLDLSGRSLGALLLLAVAGYFAAVVSRRRSIRLFGHALRLPPARLALAQLGVSVADWLLSSGALYVLLMGAGRLNYLDFLVRFLVAQVAALIVPIPGGLGVFEAVVLYLTASGAPAPPVLAALLVYRVVYYLLPLLAAGVVALARGLRQARARGRRPTAWVVEGLVRATPHLVAFTTFLSGALLLLTGTIPTDERRLAWLVRILPLPLMEVSHFFASVLGAGLLILAWGLEARVRSAYRIARLLFGVGILLTLLRAFDLRLAAGLAIALFVLVAADRAFPPTGARSLLREPMPGGWVVAIGAALVVTLWIGAVAYRGVDYSGELWWRFTLAEGAPRTLRAAVGTSVTLLLFALARFLARRTPPPLGGGHVDRSVPHGSNDPVDAEVDS